MEKSTKQYIYDHKLAVQKKMYILIKELEHRADSHDDSKLREPEYSGWLEMDKEPRYPYGTPQYFEKMRRWKWLFDLHYRHNRHHPEHWHGFFEDMDLMDVLEMMCDWVSYNDRLTSMSAIEITEQQCERFGFPPLLKDLIMNTLKNYLAVPEDLWDVMNIPRPDWRFIDLSQFY